MAPTRSHLKILINIAMTILVTNIGMTAAGDYSNLLSKLFSQPTNKNGPIIIVLDDSVSDAGPGNSLSRDTKDYTRWPRHQHRDDHSNNRDRKNRNKPNRVVFLDSNENRNNRNSHNGNRDWSFKNRHADNRNNDRDDSRDDSNDNNDRNNRDRHQTSGHRGTKTDRNRDRAISKLEESILQSPLLKSLLKISNNLALRQRPKNSCEDNDSCEEEPQPEEDNCEGPDNSCENDMSANPSTRGAFTDYVSEITPYDCGGKPCK